MSPVLTLARSLRAALVATIVVLLAFSQAAHADNPLFPPGYPRSAPAGQQDTGYLLKFDSTSLRPNLFKVLTGPSSEPIRAYCIESKVDFQYDHGLKMVGWDEFPGNNAFKTDAAVRAKVAWIAQNTYPNVSIAQLSQASGIPGLTEKEAISASQAALWGLTDKLVYQGVAESENVSPEVANRIQQLINYLTGPANTGLEQTGLWISVSSSTTPGKTGELLGPIRVESSEATVTASGTSYPLVDAEGTPVDPNAVPTGTDLFLKVPAGTPDGEATITFTATGAKYTGNLLVSDSGRTQTIVIINGEQDQFSANAIAKWQASPTPTPTPEPTPTPDPTPTPTPKPTPSSTPSNPSKLPKTGV